MAQLLYQFWPEILAAATIVVAAIASGHVVIFKRDTSTAIAWVGLIWLAPLLGVLLYIWLGVNRIERRAQLLRGEPRLNYSHDPDVVISAGEIRDHLRGKGSHLISLASLVADLTARPLMKGNRLTPLFNGDEAYPAMLGAMRDASTSISLSTYIFDDDTAGQKFVDVLAEAVARRVQVRVLIDDVGASYSWPSIVRRLHHRNVTVGRFLPKFAPRLLRYSNLRNHRKILVVDGRIGFTGGINIRQDNCLDDNPRSPIRDIHFRVEGPVVAQLQETFSDDWDFCTQERLAGEVWFPKLSAVGEVLARGVSDGPDEDFDKLRMTLHGAIACAQRSVLVATPYFLPNSDLINALCVAAMRGIELHVLLPRVNNLPYVQWASNAQLWQVLERGCRVWMTPGPFDHSKLMVVDGAWTLVGSGNWDPRSLRLNFEYNLEAYDLDFAGRMEQHLRERIAESQPVTLGAMNGRSLPIKLRDGAARLFSPYL
jgi:cardiolipin synthase